MNLLLWIVIIEYVFINFSLQVELGHSFHPELLKVLTDERNQSFQNGLILVPA